jgi:hypothetical protein
MSYSLIFSVKNEKWGKIPWLLKNKKAPTVKSCI